MSKFFFLFLWGLNCFETLCWRWLTSFLWMIFAPFSVPVGHVQWVCVGSSLYYSTYVCVYPSANTIWWCLYSYTLALKFNTLILRTLFFFNLFQLFYFYWLFIHFFRIISCLSAKEVCFELDRNSAKPMYPVGKQSFTILGLQSKSTA